MIGYPSTLPVIGARLGRYQGINVNLELPRSISLNVPVASWLQMSAFTKVQGSMYAFRNEDLNQFNRPTEILLGRRDVLSGLQANMRIGRMLALSVAAGACTGEVVRSEKTDRRLIGGRRYEFSRQDLLAAPFLQTGITLYMGKSKSNGGNNQMLDVLDLNSRYGTDDGNVQQNGETPFKANETLHKVQLRDVADLLEEQDLY